MKVTYNEAEKSIEIKDELKNQYFILKFLMILNLFNALVRLINMDKYDFGFMEILWAVTVIISLIVFYFLIFKKSNAEKISIEKIKRLKEKSFLGRKRFALELTNGKQRDLSSLKGEEDFVKVRKLLTEVGIEN